MYKTIAIQVLALTCFAVATIHAQITVPAPSPLAKAEQMVGLTNVTLEYSRPGVKGRSVFGDEGALVPYGELWRTGANKNTMITFDKDVKVAGAEVPAGTYAIFTRPAAESWEVYFYTDTENWGVPKTWDDTKVAATVQAKVMEMSEPMENFTIMFDELTATGANLYMGWDKSIAMLPVEVDTDKEVSASIEAAMAGPAASDYYNAATYYADNGKDMDQAYEWIQMANEAEPTYWQLRRQALIEAELGKKDAALATAKKSLEMAEAADNQDYVRMNEASIKEWSM